MEEQPKADAEAAAEKAESSEDEGWVGPLPSEATEPQAKKRKVLHFEKLFLDKSVSGLLFTFFTTENLF